MRKLVKKIKKVFLAIWYVICLVIAYIIGHQKYKDAWLISERGFDARDNGFVFYQYLKQFHPEIPSYFVIDTTVVDYEKVKPFGNIVPYKSWKHFLLLANAKYKISTHDQGYTPDMVIFHHLHKLAMKLPIHIYGKSIFLQHGIIGNDIKWYHKTECTPDLFVTSTKQEYEFIEKQFGQHDPELQLLCLCRYDNLIQQNSPKKQILLMPTWRKGIVNEEEFLHSTYYQTYNHLLHNETLHIWLKENQYQLVFYPHIEFQPYLHLFDETEDVILASMNEYDVQELLISSEILITDYSSVFFDFLYLEKPVYFYQFDYDSFYQNHYEKGYLKFQEMGMVTKMEEELVKQIVNRETIEIPDIFLYKDRKNCERTFEKINLLNRS